MIEIIIIGGYFTYPPEGKTFDTRLVGERIEVPPRLLACRHSRESHADCQKRR